MLFNMLVVGNFLLILLVIIVFDVVINVFYVDVIGYILFYRFDYEEISWWES